MIDAETSFPGIQIAVLLSVLKPGGHFLAVFLSCSVMGGRSFLSACMKKKAVDFLGCLFVLGFKKL